ncbi:MAG: YggS family pyridoxal phosphate-dependent enzyme [Balneolia bacterium]|nr:YggS family pyridoxal phosphate-dependent enzyme [Balneolia bacterium]
MSNVDLKSNLSEVAARIENACRACDRSPEEITLVAVSKTKPNEAIEAVRKLGHIHFGENKVQELVPKMEHFSGDDKIIWHMIGGLQSNKIKYLTDEVDWIDSVPKLKALKEINKRAEQSGREINVLIQVNISDEDQKFGCEPEDLPALIEAGENMPFVRIRGLMGIASLEEDLEKVRPQFRKLRELLQQEKAKGYKRASLDHLSMGMTNDLEVAIEEGATMVRVGSAIFGSR